MTENVYLCAHYWVQRCFFMKKYILDLTVRSVERIHDRYVLLKLTDDRPLPPMLPGQFVEIRVDQSPHTFLRRPISIHFVDLDQNELWLLVATIGEGTRWMGSLTAGKTVNCVIPLGNGFTMPLSTDERLLLIGGGVGVAPLLYMGAEMRRMGAAPTFLLGARTASDLLMLDEFAKYGKVYVTTEDGSAGEKGFVTQHTILQTPFDRIATCGPKPMMMAVARLAKMKDIDTEVSLENMMACGVGACLCCVEKTKDDSAADSNETRNVCVCKEGPVFNIKRLLWQD